MNFSNLVFSASPTTVMIVFICLIFLFLIFDLYLASKRKTAMSFRSAVVATLFWVALAVGFGAFVWHWKGPTAGLEYFTAYLIEESLSIDNLFVFLVIFSFFKIPIHAQHKVLFWGIIGALVLRAIFIWAGAALIERFSWINWVFGGILIVTAIKLAFQKDKEIQPEKNPVIRIVRKLIPVSQNFDGSNFFTRIDGKLAATPLFVAVLVVETTDVIFAVDSIPAVFSVSHDPLIVYTSNVFAIIGLRSLFFVIAGMMQLFHYLQAGLSAILAFVGVKMLLGHTYPIPIAWTLGFIGSVLVLSVLASIIFPKKEVEG